MKNHSYLIPWSYLLKRTEIKGTTTIWINNSLLDVNHCSLYVRLIHVINTLFTFLVPAMEVNILYNWFAIRKLVLTVRGLVTATVELWWGIFRGRTVFRNTLSRAGPDHFFMPGRASSEQHIAYKAYTYTRNMNFIGWNGNKIRNFTIACSRHEDTI